MMCRDTLLIVFLLDTDMRYALVYGNRVWQMGSVIFPTCVSRVTCCFYHKQLHTEAFCRLRLHSEMRSVFQGGC